MVAGSKREDDAGRVEKVRGEGKGIKSERTRATGESTGENAQDRDYISVAPCHRH
jgi:hypothetical protein